MKKIILLSLTLLCTIVWAHFTQTSLAGKITDHKTGEELIGAKVFIYQQGIRMDEVSTNFEGDYFLELERGTYDVEVSYVGYESTKVKKLIVNKGLANKLDVELETGEGAIELEDLFIRGCNAVIRKDDTAESTQLSVKDIETLAATPSDLSAGEILEQLDDSVRGLSLSETDANIKVNQPNVSEKSVNSTELTGKVTDSETGEELIGANVTMYKRGVLVTGVSTDFEGNYAIRLDPGTYDAEISFVGYMAQRITDVIVYAGRTNKLDVQLGAGGVSLDAILVTDFKTPLIQQDNTSQGSVVKAEEIAKLPTKNIANLTTTTAGLSQTAESNTISVRGGRGNRTEVYVDGVRVNADAVPSNTKKKKAKKKRTQKTKAKKSPVPAAASQQATPKVEKLPPAGQLTAGEWKDLDNWSFWKNLMKDQQFAMNRAKWGFYPDHRYELKLSDSNGQPLSHIKVNLLNQSQKVVWSAISDNKGSVCLWGNFNGGNDEKFEFEILHPDGTKKVTALEYKNGLNDIQMAPVCSASNKVDIAFVVDVSSSMHDEIRYLRSEINDVVERASSDETALEVRTGAVYYSGRNEKRFLNSSPLSKDTETTVAFLRDSPLGGGSMEAVNLGLGIAVREFDWDASAMARLVFVLLDEPPAGDEETKNDLHKVINEAAEKGIKVIPVAASGTNKSLEFLLKFMAMGTNSTYTFLTNHSGIGGNHIAPEAGSYNIETLNDLLVRLIIENAVYHDCETITAVIPEMLKTKKEYRKIRRSETNKKLTKQVRLSPNPASDYVNIDLEKAVNLLVITSMEGQVIAQYPHLDAGQIRLQTSDWATGMYLIHFRTKDGYGVLKLVVSRD